MTDPPGRAPATAEALRAILPAREDAPLAATLLRLLARGQPVSSEELAARARRPAAEVAVQLERWPNVERDASGRVVGFSGLSLRRTAHRFEVDGRRLHTWCAWDTLFLPALLNATARVRSTCPITGRKIALEVSPQAVVRAEPHELYVSFPPAASTDSSNITASFCCHVHFLAGTDAARRWSAEHPDAELLALDAAFSLGSDVTSPLTHAAASVNQNGSSEPLRT